MLIIEWAIRLTNQAVGGVALIPARQALVPVALKPLVVARRLYRPYDAFRRECLVGCPVAAGTKRKYQGQKYV